MSITIIIFLYIYFFAIIIFIVGSIFNLYHMLRFGFHGQVPVVSSGVYIAISIIILLVSIYYILQIDWKLSIDLFGGIF